VPKRPLFDPLPMCPEKKTSPSQAKPPLTVCRNDGSLPFFQGFPLDHQFSLERRRVLLSHYLALLSRLQRLLSSFSFFRDAAPPSPFEEFENLPSRTNIASFTSLAGRVFLMNLPAKGGRKLFWLEEVLFPSKLFPFPNLFYSVFASSSFFAPLSLSRQTLPFPNGAFTFPFSFFL